MVVGKTVTFRSTALRVTLLALIGAGAHPGIARAHDMPQVIVGEIERRYGPYPPCATVLAVGEADVVLLRRVKGTLVPDHIVVEMSCPGGWEVGSTRRLVLSRRRPSEWPVIRPQSAQASRWYVLSSRPL